MQLRQYFGQVQDLPLHLVDFCRGNPCGCPIVGRFSKIDMPDRYKGKSDASCFESR